MTPYKNLGGDSSVVAYSYDATSITVQFNSGSSTIYTYTYISAGSHHIEKMKKLADIGQGLGSYINTEKPGYSSKK